MVVGSGVQWGRVYTFNKLDGPDAIRSAAVPPRSCPLYADGSGPGYSYTAGGLKDDAG
jgi:hypothetical protein